MPAPLTYQFDPTASAPANLVSGEIKTISTSKSRMTTLIHGCFFAKDLVVVNLNTNSVMIMGAGFFLRGFDPELSALTGYEVASGIYFPSYTGNVSITYRAVGGYQSLNSQILNELNETINNITNTGFDWSDIGNKPDTFSPDPHQHSVITDLNDLYRLNQRFDSLLDALSGKRAVLNSNSKLSEKVDRLLYIIGSYRNLTNTLIGSAGSVGSGKENTSNKKIDLLDPLNINDSYYPSTEAVKEYGQTIIDYIDLLTEIQEPEVYRRGIEYTNLNKSLELIRGEFMHSLSALGITSLPFTTTGSWEDGGKDYPWIDSVTPSAEATLSDNFTTLTNGVIVTSDIKASSENFLLSAPDTAEDYWDHVAPPLEWAGGIPTYLVETKILSHFNNYITPTFYNSETSSSINAFWTPTSIWAYTTGGKFGGRADFNGANGTNTPKLVAASPAADATLAALNIKQPWTIDLWRFFVKPHNSDVGRVQSLFTMQYLTATSTMIMTVAIVLDYPNIDDYDFVICFKDVANTTLKYFIIPVADYTNTPSLLNDIPGWTHVELSYDLTSITLAINGQRISLITSVDPAPTSIVAILNAATTGSLVSTSLALGVGFIGGIGGYVPNAPITSKNKTFDSNTTVKIDEFRWTNDILHYSDFAPPNKAGVYRTYGTTDAYYLKGAFNPIYFKLTSANALPPNPIYIGFGSTPSNPTGKFIKLFNDTGLLGIAAVSFVSGTETVISSINTATTGIWKNGPCLIWLDNTSEDNSSPDVDDDSGRICFGYVSNTTTGEVTVLYVSDLITNLKSPSLLSIIYISEDPNLKISLYNRSKLGTADFPVSPDNCFAFVAAGTSLGGSPVYGETATKNYIFKFNESIMIKGIPGDKTKFVYNNHDSKSVLFNFNNQLGSNTKIKAKDLENAVLELEGNIQSITSSVYRALSVPKRQTVLSGQVDVNGLPNLFATSSGILDGGVIKYSNLITVPLTVTFGSGFDEKGAVDYVISSDDPFTWSLTPSTPNMYLYLTLDKDTGVVTTGYTTVAPVYSQVRPAGASNLFWYPTDHRSRGERWDGTAWVPQLRVYLGLVTTDATTVTTAVTFAYQGKYVYGSLANTPIIWPAGGVTGGWSVTFTDKLYSGKFNKNIKISYVAGTTSGGITAGNVIDLQFQNNTKGGGNGEYAGNTAKITDTTVVCSYYQNGNNTGIYFATTAAAAVTASSTTANGYLIATIERSF